MLFHPRHSFWSSSSLHKRHVRTRGSSNIPRVPHSYRLSSALQTARAFSTTRISYKQHGGTDHEANHKSQQKLTHLNSSGDAHMVQIPPPYPPTFTSVPSPPTNSDEKPQVTHKPVTTRKSTAVAHIIFSNPQPYRLIHASLYPDQGEANATDAKPRTLPKGDVIGTSRIAGIMAAKRTADLIPLCHNVPLAGVSVNIELVAPTSESTSAPASDSTMAEDAAAEVHTHNGPYGSIAVTASVTAHAQTGVEMEALTAVTVASLSVYDMCKAVDRGMSMTGVRVVFKSGGRSGTWGDAGTSLS